MADSIPPFLHPLVVVDLKAILEQIRSAIELLLPVPSALYSESSRQTNNGISRLMREVIKLAKTGFFPDLGPSLFALYQELDVSENCSALLEKKWCPIEDDCQTKDFLIAMIYLKLSAMCAFDEARHVWVALAKKVKDERLPYDAMEDLDLIKLYKEARRNDYITACHEFVGNDMYLICKAYKRSCLTYRFYKLLLKGPYIPWGQTCGGYDGNVNTDQMVRFIIEQLEEK